MPPALLEPEEEEDYISGEDSDFAPDTVGAPASGSDESGHESEEQHDKSKRKGKPAKRSIETQEAEDAGFANSGDEAIIQKGLKKKRWKHKKGTRDEDDFEDEGGPGGFIKTRRQRALEKEEKKIITEVTAPTVDVDAVWARMKAGAPPPRPIAPDEVILDSSIEPSDAPKGQEASEASQQKHHHKDPNAMVLIKRTYTFAGKTHTEEKLVPRHSAEAKLFLASQTEKPQASPTEAAPPDPSVPTKPAPRKAFRSRFEPVVDMPIRTDLKFGVRARAQEPARKWGAVEEDKGKKLNTVEKSALDWAGFVDREGIEEELVQAGKAKGAYAERQQFLARVEDKRVLEERRARGLPV